MNRNMRDALTGHEPTDNMIIKLSRETVLNIWQARQVYLAVGDFEIATEIARAYSVTGGNWAVVEELIRWHHETRTGNITSPLQRIQDIIKRDKWYNRLGRWIRRTFGYERQN